MSVGQDPESYECFIQRAKMSANQRKYAAAATHNPNPGYAIVHPQHAETLLIRDVDDMNEDQILDIFMPTFKDDIMGIRLFPPIPGTRGFAFIDFKEAFAAIRAFTCKHRSQFMYKGNMKQVNLSRITKGSTTDTESKWMKYQERTKRNNGEYDSTPRRKALVPGAYNNSNGPMDNIFKDSVQTVPLTEVVQAKEAKDIIAEVSHANDSSSDQRALTATQDSDRPRETRDDERRTSERRDDDWKHSDRRRDDREDDRRYTDRRRDDRDDDRKYGDRRSYDDRRRSEREQVNPFRDDDRTRSRDPRDDRYDDRKRYRTDDRRSYR